MLQRNLWWWCILAPCLAMMPLFVLNPREYPWVPTVFMALVMTTLLAPLAAALGVAWWTHRQHQRRVDQEVKALWNRLGVQRLTAPVLRQRRRPPLPPPLLRRGHRPRWDPRHDVDLAPSPPSRMERVEVRKGRAHGPDLPWG